MRKRILTVGSIITVLLLVLISFSSVVYSQKTKSFTLNEENKESLVFPQNLISDTNWRPGKFLAKICSTFALILFALLFEYFWDFPGSSLFIQVIQLLLISIIWVFVIISCILDPTLMPPPLQ